MSRQSKPRCRCVFIVLFQIVAVSLLASYGIAKQFGSTVDGTDPLELQGDIASQMIEGIDRFLLRQIESTSTKRNLVWKDFREFSRGLDRDPDRYRALLEGHRQRLAEMFGVRDQRSSPSELCRVQKLTPSAHGQPEGDSLEVQQVRWSVLPGTWGEGLMIERSSADEKTAAVTYIVLPDSDQNAEQLLGLEEGVDVSQQYARNLANQGFRVIIPSTLSRDLHKRGPPGEPSRVELTNREFIYRPAFQLGRHVLGYEIQTLLALVDLVNQDADAQHARERIVVVGIGEGALVALAAAALDSRIDELFITGYFGSRENVWQEPVDRNLFGLLNEFGDAELAALVAPRPILIHFAARPGCKIQSSGGAPGRLLPISPQERNREILRLFSLLEIDLLADGKPTEIKPGKQPESSEDRLSIPNGDNAQGVLISNRVVNWIQNESLEDIAKVSPTLAAVCDTPRLAKALVSSVIADAGQREERLVRQWIEHTQVLLRGAAAQRRDYLKDLNTGSLEDFNQSVERYRQDFREKLIGHIDQPLLPVAVKTRLSWEHVRWLGYEVTIDVFEGVFAYGVLLVPRDMAADEKRPVVVCQHGLEGRPTDLFLNDHPAYHNYAAKLCEQGYVVFAPQNIYIFQDRFRSLQRKANSIGLTLFSVMVPQHQQILNWLKSQPWVDARRIGFYGLSYGGKSAMRIPALVKDYQLSICSADFNEWIVKNASTTDSFSYVWTGEYEIYEFNLGNTFGYAEMAALICPRPFMVERGHFDAVASDEWVGYEFAKVQHLYQAKLNLQNRARLEWFRGPHTIHGQGTFRFLDEFLKHPSTGGQ